MGNFFNAILKWISLGLWRKGEAVKRDAYGQFTKDEQGMRDGAKMEKDKLKATIDESIKAIADMEMAKASKEQILAASEKQCEKLERGIKATLAEAMSAGNPELAAQAKEKGNKFIEMLNKEKAKVEQLKVDIKASAERLTPHKKKLAEKVERLRSIDAKAAELILRHVAAETEKRENARLLQIEKESDESILDHIEDSVMKDEAEARVTSELAGIVDNDVLTEYAAKGEQVSASSEFDKMLAAMQAEKAAKDAPQTNNTNDRPDII